MAPYPGIYGKHKLDWMGYYKRENIKLKCRIGCRVDLEELGRGLKGEYDQNTLHGIIR